MEIVENEEIKNITTYKTFGNVKKVFYPKSQSELIDCFENLKSKNVPFFLVGNGSNLLISPSTDKYIISTKKIKQTTRFIDNGAYFSSSVPISKAFALTLKHELSGFEALAGIPSNIGGAIKMNASAFGSSIFDNLDYVKIYKEGKIKFVKKDEIEYSYHSTSLNDCIILSCKFTLTPLKKEEIYNNFRLFLEKRNFAQPKGNSCGSVFKNPLPFFAGQLIESCGLKGYSHKDAQISTKHANFIINNGNASFEDVIFLINLCKEKVLKQFGINLETEVEIVR